MAVWAIFNSLLLSVLMWHLWIESGSGNANFYFFQTLLFVGAQSFLLLEALLAMRRALARARSAPSTAASATAVS